MTNVHRVASDLSAGILAMPPLFQCSRVELGISEEAKMIMVLLRTQPELSGALFTTPEFQYPLQLLMNTASVFGVASEGIDRGEIVPAQNELISAARAGVAKGELHGAWVDRNTNTFHVPAIAGFQSERAVEWGGVLLSPLTLMMSSIVSPDAITLYVVHLPDTPVNELSEEALLQLATLSVGWNYRSPSLESHFHVVAHAIRFMASNNPQLIVHYDQ